MTRNSGPEEGHDSSVFAGFEKCGSYRYGDIFHTADSPIHESIRKPLDFMETNWRLNANVRCTKKIRVKQTDFPEQVKVKTTARLSNHLVPKSQITSSIEQGGRQPDSPPEKLQKHWLKCLRKSSPLKFLKKSILLKLTLSSL